MKEIRLELGVALALLAGGFIFTPTAVGEDTTMKTTVRHKADRVWIEGVKGWFCGEKESSVHAAQEAVMQAVGESVTYEYLLGVSGLAFRMQVSKQRVLPKLAALVLRLPVRRWVGKGDPVESENLRDV